MRVIIVSAVALSMSVLSGLSAQAQDAPAQTVSSSVGEILVTPSGRTLYTFDKDSEGVSNCDAKCLILWPAFYVSGDTKAPLGWTVVKASDGKDMWAYNGDPLYLFIKDTQAGEIKGNGVGGVWHVAR